MSTMRDERLEVRKRVAYLHFATHRSSLIAHPASGENA